MKNKTTIMLMIKHFIIIIYTLDATHEDNIHNMAMFMTMDLPNTFK